MFNYYYMTPNYNLKLTNHEPVPDIEIPQKFPDEKGRIVQNLLSPSQNVIKLCENEQVFKIKIAKKQKKKKKTKNEIGSKIKSKKTQPIPKQIKKKIKKKSFKEDAKLKIFTNIFSEKETCLETNPMTPSFFKKKKVYEVEANHLLSRETSYINNSNNQQKITFGLLPYSQDKTIRDLESSMSIPLNKSNVLIQESPEHKYESNKLVGDSPHVSKKFYENSNMLYSSMAFSISSSLDTSTKFSKLLAKDKKKNEINFSQKDVVNKSMNMTKNNKDKVKLLKSKRKSQIQKLKERTGFKQLKKDYQKAKIKTRKYSQKNNPLTYLKQVNSSKGIKNQNYSVRMSNKYVVNASIKNCHKNIQEDQNDEFERRIVASMRKTTDTAAVKQSDRDMIDRQLMSVQTSKIHSNMFENLFKEGQKKALKDEDKKSPNLMIFKQRMSSNVDLGRKKKLLEEREGNQGLNQSIVQRDLAQFPREYGDFKEKSQGRGKKQSWKDTPSCSLRKNTSLDLVLKKKSMKFMDMQKEILKNINKNVKNIYRLSSPSLKNIEDSIMKTESITLGNRKMSKKVRKNYSKKPNKNKFLKQIHQNLKAGKKKIGSLDFDEMENRNKSIPKTFETSMKLFRGRRLTRQFERDQKVREPRFQRQEAVCQKTVKLPKKRADF